jgi:hypothetical protein
MDKVHVSLSEYFQCYARNNRQLTLDISNSILMPEGKVGLSSY